MSPRSGSVERHRRTVGVAGVLAAMTCTLGCCLPPILVAFGAGAAGAGMAGMSPHRDTGLLGLVHRISPMLLIVSIVLVAVAFALRRRTAALPALLAGGVLYGSLHLQSDPVLMYVGMAAGYGAWIALYFWTRPGGDRGCAGDGV